MIKSKKRPSEDTSTSEKKKLKTHHSTGKQKANNIVARTKRTNNFQNKTKFNKKTHIGKGNIGCFLYTIHRQILRNAYVRPLYEQCSCHKHHWSVFLLLYK